MKKGKRSTLVVLAVEILTITVLHAVKISHAEKMTSAREVSKNVFSKAENQTESKSGSVYTLTSYK